MKKMILTVLLTMALFLPLFLLPAGNAAKPNVVEDVWFVAIYASSVPGKIFWTGDGTILHNQGTISSWNVFRSPPGGSGSILIGSLKTESYIDFNTKTGEGNANVKMTLNFTSANKTRNPYGVGVLEGTAVEKITSLHPNIPNGVGNATGVLVATHGTGAFENAKLTIVFLLAPFPSAQNGPIEGIFFGAHPRVNGAGTLTYHNTGP